MKRAVRLRPKCACGCGEYVTWNKNKRCWNMYVSGHNSCKNKSWEPKSPSQECACGCGEMTEPGCKYVNTHHNPRLGTGRRKPKKHKCFCGCGMYTNKPENKYIAGHQVKFRVFSNQAIQKLSFQKMGDKNPAKRKDVREKISQAVLKLELKGENHYNWQGGISKEPYSQDWTKTLKEAIRQRDNYTCQICCTPQRELYQKLDVHHIDYDKENCDPDNLISLCHSCHMKTSSKRDKYISFFNGRNILQGIA